MGEREKRETSLTIISIKSSKITINNLRFRIKTKRERERERREREEKEKKKREGKLKKKIGLKVLCSDSVNQILDQIHQKLRLPEREHFGLFCPLKAEYLQGFFYFLFFIFYFLFFIFYFLFFIFYFLFLFLFLYLFYFLNSKISHFSYFFLLLY